MTKIQKPKMKKYREPTGNCKVCRHEHRLEIETAMLVECKSSRETEKMIKDNGWEEVSYATILNHMNNHMDAKRELIVKYLYEKKQLLEGNMTMEDPEVDEMQVRLNELRRLDASIQEASILVRQSSKVLQEQLSIRVEQPDKNNKTKSGAKVTGPDGKDPDRKRFYVPIQRDLVALYKSASEELRMSMKTKLDLLGIDANSRKADSMETLVDLIMETDEDEKE